MCRAQVNYSWSLSYVWHCGIFVLWFLLLKLAAEPFRHRWCWDVWDRRWCSSRATKTSPGIPWSPSCGPRSSPPGLVRSADAPPSWPLRTNLCPACLRGDTRSWGTSSPDWWCLPYAPWSTRRAVAAVSLHLETRLISAGATCDLLTSHSLPPATLIFLSLSNLLVNNQNHPKIDTGPHCIVLATVFRAAAESQLRSSSSSSVFFRDVGLVGFFDFSVFVVCDAVGGEVTWLRTFDRDAGDTSLTSTVICWRNVLQNNAAETSPE